MAKQQVLFRADGDSKMGLGHVVRSLALVDMLKSEFSCSFAITCPTREVLAMLKNSCDHIIELADLDDATFLNCLKGNEIVIIDGYHFSSELGSKIRKRAFRLAAIEDECRDWESADMVINFGLATPALTATQNGSTRLLLGLKYLIVRSCFISSAKQERSLTTITTAFICMGGADPFNVTLKAFNACTRTSFITRINIVVGSAYVHEDMVCYSKLSGKNVHVYRSITASEMATLISTSDIALTTASSIALEACCVKTGLIIGTVADNQQNIHDNLLANGCCISIGDWRSASVEQIIDCINAIGEVSVVQTMVNRQKDIIDGLSDQRILGEFKKMTC